MGKNRRSVLLINPGFQLRILGYFVGLSLLVITIFYGANFWFFMQLKEKGLDAGLEPNHPFFYFLKDQIQLMNIIFIVTTIVTVFVISIAGLVISHRVAGPIYRLTNNLKRFYEADIDELRFRKKDFFPELTDEASKLLRKLKEDKGK